jgi:hypothetical protein
MGNEARCTVRFGAQKFEGKALLETEDLIFRGEKFRLKIAFTEMKSVKALNGDLQIAFPDGTAVFELGPLAEKWAHKILHPKTLVEKLGVKSELKVSLLGAVDGESYKELREQTKNIFRSQIPADAELIFLGAESRNDLSQVKKIAKDLRGAAVLWIVYPKGQKTISENHVLAAGHEAGLKDVKVVGFSSTHTALKFVIPVSKR